jgi:hypothetical protein
MLVMVLILTKLNAALASEKAHATFILILPNPSLGERGVVTETKAVTKVSMKKYAGN